MFEIHRNSLRNPGVVGDLSREWKRIVKDLPGLDAAVAGARRILDPWDGTLRDPVNYRIVEVDGKGKIVALYDTDGVEQPILLPSKLLVLA